MISLTFLLSFLSGVLYRLGGAAGWNTKYRDVGVPLMASLVIFANGVTNPIVHVTSFALLFVSLTTYNKWASRLFGYTDGDVHWPSWCVTGITYGLAAIPIAVLTGNWIGLLIRTASLGVFVPVWCELNNIDWVEEGGRGVAITLSLLLMV